MAKENSFGVQIQNQPLTKCVTLSNLASRSFRDPYLSAVKRDTLESSSQGCLMKTTICGKHKEQCLAQSKCSVNGFRYDNEGERHSAPSFQKQ